MVQNFRRANAQERAVAQSEVVTSQDLEDGQTLSSDVFRGVFEIVPTRTTKYAPGYGSGNRQASEVGWFDLDLQGDNTSGNGSDLRGKARWVKYRSEEKESIMRVSSTYSLQTLRNSVAADLTDKKTLGQLAPFANTDRPLELQVRVNSPYDGDSVDAGASNVDEGVPYARIEV
jgi:hypothetical protein